LAVVLAVLVGRPAFAVFAVPPLWLVFVARPARECGIRVNVSIDQDRCFEGDTVVVSATIVADVGLTFDARLRTPAGVAVLDGVTRFAANANRVEFTWRLRANRWGRWPVGPVILGAYDDGLLASTTVRSAVAALTIFPATDGLRHLPLPRTLPNRLGDHVGRAIGEGVEFAGIRPLVPGDSLRRMNWRATARHRRPYITQFNAERAAEVVVVVDGFSDVGPPGLGSVDISLRGAATLAQSYLASHDRVGAMALGGVLRWVGGQSDATQFYRIVEALLDVRDFVSVVRPSLDRLPRAALPAGSLVVLFSPLLDERAIEIARDLRQRRYPLIVVDVLNTEPYVRPTSTAAGLALRLWRLEQRAMRGQLSDLGARVVAWDGRGPIESALAALPPAGRIA
jgi:uncharacterized protein (DUF58 family)